jgi:tetratricopeptide (TPR) repeat protein
MVRPVDMAGIPHDISIHFGEDLREIPNNPEQMRHAVSFLREQLRESGMTPAERARTLGLLGSLCRMLGDYDDAGIWLTEALSLSEECGNIGAAVTNRIRLAHLAQWRGDFEESTSAFTELTVICRSTPELLSRLDFALQHAGKNLFDQGRHQEALPLFEEALALRERKGDAELIASTRYALGVVIERMTRGARADSHETFR